VWSEWTARAATAPVPGAFGFPLGAAAATLVTIAAVAAGATDHPAAAMIALAVCVAAVAVVTTPAATLGTAAVCWLLQAGFVVGREGAVSVTTRSGREAAVLAAVAVGAIAVTGAVRLLRSRYATVESRSAAAASTPSIAAMSTWRSADTTNETASSPAALGSSRSSR
jgi:hypothetical protein